MGIKQRLFVIFTASLCLIYTSCAGSKREELQKFVRLVHFVQSNHDKFGENEWGRVERQVLSFRNTMSGRYSNSLTQEEVRRISQGIHIINTYRSLNRLVGSTTDNQDNNGDRIDGLFRLLDDGQMQNPPPGTEQQLLSERLINDILMALNASIRDGRPDISGRIKVVVIPTVYQRNPFRMNHNDLTPAIREAIDIIITQARRYNQRIAIDWEFRTYGGQYISLDSSTDRVRHHSQYRNMFPAYNYVVVVNAVDMNGRSYCSVHVPFGVSEFNAITWFKDDNSHCARVLAHEIFHAFGAEDLYFEQGVVVRDVEDNFKTMYGNSIMADHWETSDLDPINAWLLGWNRNPELWYSYFINRRDASAIRFIQDQGWN